MAALDTTPTNQNFLSPLGFKFVIQKTPSTNYFVQQCNIPAMATGDLLQPTPFIGVPVPGDHLTFGSLSLTFRVDEDLQNYTELFNWMKGIGFPETYTQRRDELVRNSTFDPSSSLYSDGTLLIMNSNMNPNKEVIFRDLYPVNLGDVLFDVTQTDVEYVTCTCDFRFRTFELNSL